MMDEDSFFKGIDIPVSEYPSNFIPAGGKTFVVVDPAAEVGQSFEVKGFWKDGEFHIQEINKL